MREGAARRSLRRALWWSVGSRGSVALVLVLCVAAGIRVPPLVRLALELTTAIPVLTLATVLARAYLRHRREGLGRRAAAGAVYADAIPRPARKLMVHEISLFTSTLRWLTLRRHGVRAGDTAVPYASGAAALLWVFAYVSAIETVALALIIPWPAVREITLVLDIWGVYFIIALYASFVVRPHVVHADGSLRLRCGALVDIRIPADDIVAARVEPRPARRMLAPATPDGRADLSIGGQTTVTVELARPVTFIRPLGKTARASTFRYYAADPAAAVAALRAPASRARMCRQAAHTTPIQRE